MIHKYKKKPVEIEAVEIIEFEEEEFKTFSEWMGDSLVVDENQHFRVKTLEGHSYPITLDDYIIKGVNNEFYPCKKDIFELTYERVEG